MEAFLALLTRKTNVARRQRGEMEEEETPAESLFQSLPRPPEPPQISGSLRHATPPHRRVVFWALCSACITLIGVFVTCLTFILSKAIDRDEVWRYISQNCTQLNKRVRKMCSSVFLSLARGREGERKKCRRKRIIMLRQGRGREKLQEGRKSQPPSSPSLHLLLSSSRGVGERTFRSGCQVAARGYS